MKILQYIISYISLFFMIYVLIILWNGELFGGGKLTDIDRIILLFLVFFPLSYVYRKLKPFSLTRDIDEIIKQKFTKYLNSQKECKNCGKVISRDELKEDENCPFCGKKNIKRISSNEKSIFISINYNKSFSKWI